MKKRLLSTLLVSVMVLGLVGCGSTSQEEIVQSETTENVVSEAETKVETNTEVEVTETDDVKTISVILKTLNSEYWGAVAAGIRQAEADLGCKVLLQGPPSESSYDEQLNMIETTLSSSESDALVLAPLQPDSAANAVKNATIPILSVDTTFESEKLISYIGVSNEQAAEAGGKYIAEKLGGSGNVVILAGVQGDTTSEDRIVGWTKGLEAGGCTVLDMQYTDAVADKAVISIEGLMQQYPDQIDAVVTHSDDVAMGASTAIESAGKSDEIIVCGFGGISGANPVKEGILTATVDIGPYVMGYDCVARALDVINGKEIEDFYPSEASIIDADNVDEFLLKLAEWTN